MGNQWTTEQKAAIDTPHCDLLVAAAAGSGKTAVLVERIISMVTNKDHPIDIDKLLVVTFTKAAASEMSQRIGEAIIEKLKEEPSNTHLQNQLTLLHRADIKTIHSFCLQVIKENYFAIDIDPAARTADPGEIKLLQMEVINDVFEELYEQEDNGAFCSLVEYFADATSDQKLKDCILQIYSFIQGCPQPLQWLHQATEDLQRDMEDAKWMPVIRESMAMDVEAALYQLKQAYERASAEPDFDGYAGRLEEEIDMVEEFQSFLCFDFEQVYVAYGKIKFKTIPAYRGENSDLATEIKGLRSNGKKLLEGIAKKYFPYAPSAIKEHLSRLYPIGKTLYHVVSLFTEQFQEAKREKQILDFNDYEHFCMQILFTENEHKEMVPSPAAVALQNKYAEIFIDEYQDSNMVQEMILEAVSKKSQEKNNRFMVGDVKQSIYRFRLAMPEIFMDKYERYPSSKNEKEKRIILSKNFRSRENILWGVNFLFRQIMSKQVGEMEYGEEEALYPGMTFPPTDVYCGGENEVLMIDGSEYGEIEDAVLDELEDMNRKELEATVIAERIVKLRKDNYHVWDKELKAYRPVEFSDITILMRSTRSWSDVFDMVFLKYEIPFYSELSIGYFDTPEVSTVLNFLQIIDNPRQDIPLISVLYSPVYRFCADELMDIRLSGLAHMDYYDCMKVYLEHCNLGLAGMDFEVGLKLKQFFDDLQCWRTIASNEPISVLLWRLYELTGYFDYVGITQGGNIRQGNLRALIEKAQQFEDTSRKSLFHFIKYIESIKSTDENNRTAKVINENENLVKIMTIHKSKGLEFPIVFVSDLGKDFNKTDTKADIILHQNLGMAFRYKNIEERTIYITLSKSAIGQKIKDENLSEEMRVLYVALTRAKEKLILTGYKKNFFKKHGDWLLISDHRQQQLPAFAMKQAGNYLDWIIPALLRHPNLSVPPENCRKEWMTPTYFFEEEASKWKMQLFSKEMIQLNQYHKKEALIELHEDFSHWDNQQDYSGKRNQIFQQLQWEYQNKAATLLPVKVSVSEMKRRSYEENGEKTMEAFYGQEWNPIFRKGDFGKENRKLTGAEAGQAIHTFMEHCDFRREYTPLDIQSAIDTMVKQGVLTQEEAASIDQTAVLSFFESSLAERLRKAEWIGKEQPFAMTISPQEAYLKGNFESLEENILVNGMIDCYFYEKNDIILLDYKNDRIYNGGESVLKERYKVQLEIYKKALERATGKTVKESYIYSFALKKSIAIDL